jgi:hypothetical protein
VATPEMSAKAPMVSRIFVKLNNAFSFVLNERDDGKSVAEKPKLV